MAKCSIDGCDFEVKRRGWCGGHYERWKRYGDPLKGKAKRRVYDYGQVCLVHGCESPVSKRGWCNKHYLRWRQHGDPLAGGVEHCNYTVESECVIEGCDRTPRARGLCDRHYISLRKYGDPAKAKWRWSGHRKEWHVGAQGYMVRYEATNPNAGSSGYVYQHRQVMADIIGRRLLPFENVHHKNGNRADNTAGNLELWVSAQPSGQRVQDLVAWAEKIIAEYGAVAALVTAQS